MIVGSQYFKDSRQIVSGQILRVILGPRLQGTFICTREDRERIALTLPKRKTGHALKQPENLATRRIISHVVLLDRIRHYRPMVLAVEHVVTVVFRQRADKFFPTKPAGQTVQQVWRSRFLLLQECVHPDNAYPPTTTASVRRALHQFLPTNTCGQRYREENNLDNQLALLETMAPRYPQPESPGHYELRRSQFRSETDRKEVLKDSYVRAANQAIPASEDLEIRIRTSNAEKCGFLPFRFPLPTCT
ncbi:hypothetical protein BGLA2_990097 [Burkholderia gladioli]|nr:hypothetical protein BGLA2_990097 [Burkholderia gladioli]